MGWVGDVRLMLMLEKSTAVGSAVATGAILTVFPTEGIEPVIRLAR